MGLTPRVVQGTGLGLERFLGQTLHQQVPAVATSGHSCFRKLRSFFLFPLSLLGDAMPKGHSGHPQPRGGRGWGGCACMAGSAGGRAAREHLKGLMIAFGPRLSSIIGYWIQMEIQDPESPAQQREPSAALWSCQYLEFHGVSMSGKSQGPCQRDVLRFPFIPHIVL